MAARDLIALKMALLREARKVEEAAKDKTDNRENDKNNNRAQTGTPPPTSLPVFAPSGSLGEGATRNAWGMEVGDLSGGWGVVEPPPRNNPCFW